MELGSGITLAERNGCPKTIEVPVNCVEFVEPENAGAGCLDLLKDLGNSEVVRGPETLFCNIDPFERWGRFPASVLRDATGSSLQFDFASGNGNCQQASQFTREMRMNGEGISQSGSQCMDSFYWADHGVSSSEMMIRFTPITPDKNKPVVDNRQTDANGLEEGVINKRIRQESNLGGMNSIHHNPAYMFFGEPSLSLGSQIPQTVDFQLTGNNTCMDLSAPVTPDKWKTVQKISTRKDDDLFFQEKLEGNGQKTKHVTSETVLEPSSQQESQKQIVEESLDANQENTPRQKTRRRKHRPKVVIEGKPAKQRKQMTPKPVSTPENPRVKRKYVRKEKKNLPETSIGVGGEHASSTSVQQSAKRVLNFDVQEAQLESVHKDPGAGSECNVDAHHRPCNESNIHSTNAENESKYDMLTQRKQSDDCAILFSPPNVFGTTESTAGPSEKIASDAGHPVNKVVEELKSQGYSVRIIPPSRRNMLRENLKELARDRDNLELQRMAGRIFDQEITKNKRSKRDRISLTTDTKRRFEMWNGYGRLPNGSVCNGRYILPVTFIPEQCKRKRTKAAASEQAPNVAPNVSSSPVPSLSNQAPSLESGQKMVTCLPSDYAARSNQTGLKIKFTMSSQAQKQDLIAEANAACFRQIPIIPRSSIVCYRTPVFDEQQAVTEVTTPKPLRKRRTKKGQTPEANVIPLHPPPRKDRVYKSPMLHSSYFSQTNILELVEFLIQRLIRLNINAIPEETIPSSLQQENAIVPYNGGGAMVPFDNLSITPKKKKPRAKVDLDNETNRVWLLLMGMPSLNAPDGTDAEKEKWWEDERRVFHGRAESFIARMHLVQGDRRFSPWKGSVVDSVVGVFLTQNVSDHLSSSAYMNLAARFPVTRNVAHVEAKVSPEKEDSYLVEFDEYVKDEEKVSRCPVTSQDTRVVILEDDENAEEKEILHDIGSHGEDTRSGTVSCSDSLAEIPIAQLTTEGTNLEACITSLESTFNGLNSVASSQNSSDSPIQASNSTSMPLKLHRDQSHLPDAKTCYGLSASTSFTELLHLVGSNMLHLRSNFVAEEKKETAADHICKPDVCLSIGGYDSYLHQQQNDSTRVSCVSSTTNIYNGEYHETGLENAKVSGETQSASAIQGVTDKWNFENSCIGSVTKRTDMATCQEASVTQSTSSCDSHTKITSHFDGSQGEVHSEQQLCNHCLPPAPFDNCTAGFQQIYSSKDFPEMNSKDSSMQVPSSEAHEIDASQANMCPLSRASDGSKSSCTTRPEEKMSTTIVSNTKDENLHTEISNAGKPKRKRVEKVASEPIDWDLLRKHACCRTVKKERSKETMDSIDWEAIRRADVSEISDAIRERGMNNRLAQRIKEFLDRVVKDHGSIDLEWLRDVPPDKVKDYLLSIKGLGLKSVECVRLLTLHHLAFPVDTNVGRICVRLGWVPLQPLPESLQLHLLEMYPILETIQKYLWPRLCKLDQRTLYELHYQMITFGKVFCTKSKPNCNACPMRGECRHFASAFASARLALPGPEEKGLVVSTAPVTSTHEPQPNVMPMPLPQLEDNPLREERLRTNCEPIIEEPASPEPGCLEAPAAEIEDFYYEDPDEIPTIKLNIEKFTENLQMIMQQNNMELPEADISKALVALTPEAASIPQPKLKNVSRLRTEHQVYELPDSHPLAEGLDQREPDDPSPYLLAIWSPGETAQSTELPEASCSFRGTGVLCDMETCSACNSIRETRAQIVRGTLLIPCRTAMRGSFPLNGTYFQVNEVFADHSSSLNPINIPRQWIWNLARRTVYFGTSVPTIFKGLTTETIQQCFWRGFVCVRGFDRETRAPRPLMARLHFPASKAPKNKKAPVQEKKGQ